MEGKFMLFLDDYRQPVDCVVYIKKYLYGR